MEEKIVKEVESKGKIIAILSMVLSGIPFLGIVLGIISLSTEKEKAARKMAIIGIALNIIIPIFLTIALTIGGFYAYYSYERNWNRMYDQFLSDMRQNDQDRIIELIKEKYHPSAHLEYRKGVLIIRQYDETYSGSEIMKNVLVPLNETYKELLSIDGINKIIIENELVNEMYVSIELTDEQAEELDADVIDDLMAEEDYFSVMDYFDFYTGIYSY